MTTASTLFGDPPCDLNFDLDEGKAGGGAATAPDFVSDLLPAIALTQIALVTPGCHVLTPRQLCLVSAVGTTIMLLM